jgi:hypothetical protein
MFRYGTFAVPDRHAAPSDDAGVTTNQQGPEDSARTIQGLYIPRKLIPAGTNSKDETADVVPSACWQYKSGRTLQDNGA